VTRPHTSFTTKADRRQSAEGDRLLRTGNRTRFKLRARLCRSANSYVLLPLYFSVPQRDAMAKARDAALKALQIDPKLAEAHNALGKILNFDDLDLAAAESEFQRAIDLQPNNATAHQWYGNGPLDSLGRFDEAVAETKRAVELDPLSPIINTDRAYPLYYAHRYDEAMAQAKKTIELDPGFFYSRQILGMVLQAKGDLPGAIAEFEKARQLSGDPLHLVLLAVTKTKMGDKPSRSKFWSNSTK